MLNKKGFTIAEVIVSFSLITVILASVISSTVYYRGKLKDEEVITQLIDFKETITRILYDDILTRNDNKLVKVERCIGTQNCINFTDKVGNSHVLKVEDYTQTDPITNIKRGVYLDYDDTKYMLPDSDLGSGDARICDFISDVDVFDIKEYEEGDLYSYTVKLSYEHTGLDKQYDIMFNIIGKEGMWVSSNIRDESRITLEEESLALEYGTSGTNEYTYTGDGTVRCSSSDTEYVTCSVDEENHNIVVIPQALTASPITITVSADPTMNYLSPLNATFTVEVGASVATIYFDANGGTVSPTSKEIAIPGSETYGPLPTASKDGYAFIGWYTEENGGTKVVSSTPYIHGESPTQLYAHYAQSAAAMISSDSSLSEVADAKRYVGPTPSNYVKFNCSNPSDSSTCENWRIIGVYENSLKIVRVEPIINSNLQYDYSGSNVWAGSTLENYLNETAAGGYYYTLNQSAKDMIVSGVWNTGPSDGSEAATYYTNAKTTTVTRKVGLIAVYEYLYATNRSACLTTSSLTFSGCGSYNWLYSTLTSSSSKHAFTISPGKSSTTLASNINSSAGTIGTVTATSYLVNYVASPVVYLNPNVVITGGTGVSTMGAYTLGYYQE